MRVISREDFRSLFARHAFADRPNQQHDRVSRLVKLLTFGRTTSEDLLHHWSERLEAPGPEIASSMLGPRVHVVPDNDAKYDHASALLHVLLKGMEQMHRQTSRTGLL